MYIYYNNELYHHGVQGQKWGVRNAEWYPIDAWKASLKNKDKNEKEIGSEGLNNTITDFIENKKKLKLSGDASSAIMATTFVAAYLASTVAAIAIGVRRMKTNAIDHESKMLENAYDNREIDTLESIPKLSKPMSAENSMKITNPGYPSEGRTMNCTYCTVAMAMREKGYDVIAAETNEPHVSAMIFGYGFESDFEHITVSKDSAYDAMLDSLAKNGEGSYGHLSVNWKVGGGHSVFWKVVNGKTRIYDGQTGEELTASDVTMKKIWNSINLTEINYNRLDNHEPTDAVLGLLKPNKK